MTAIHHWSRRLSGRRASAEADCLVAVEELPPSLLDPQRFPRDFAVVRLALKRIRLGMSAPGASILYGVTITPAEVEEALSARADAELEAAVPRRHGTRVHPAFAETSQPSTAAVADSEARPAKPNSVANARQGPEALQPAPGRRAAIGRTRPKRKVNRTPSRRFKRGFGPSPWK